MTRANFGDLAALQRSLVSIMDEPAVLRVLRGDANPDGHLVQNDINGMDLIRSDTATYLGTSGTVRSRGSPPPPLFNPVMVLYRVF